MRWFQHAALVYNQREPLIPQEVPGRPWATVAADIFYYKGRDYLLVVDYFSKYPEVARLNHKNSEAVILAMKDMFARHGIPEKIIADNMPFNSLRVKEFAREWEVDVVTSSPHYPRSNGLVERNVQTIKRLLKKADDSKQDAFLALLEFRNSPISGMEQSPAELLMSRKLRTKLPTPKHLLKPKPQPVNDVCQRLRLRQQRQKAHYDRGTKLLSPLCPNESVRIRQGREWNPAVVIDQHQAPRSYVIATPDGTQLRRNRIHLLPTKEPPIVISSPMEPDSVEYRSPHSPPPEVIAEEVQMSRPVVQTNQPLRRSTRIRHAPSRLIETMG